MKKAGIFIIIVGILLTVFTSVTYFRREKVVDIGSLVVTAKTRHNFEWNPLYGVGVLVLGGVVYLFSGKK